MVDEYMNKPKLLRNLYAAYNANKTGNLSVSDQHTLYWEESGNPKGVPVIALHGGPGGGSSPQMRRFFDARKYRVILSDQRGCGKSTPHSELEENTTWHLVEDIEKLRQTLGIEKWVLFGGSWGSTLALAYAVTYPERVLGIILRGVFLLTQAELRWFYQEGASRLFPDAFDRFLDPIPEEERHDLITAYHARLTCDDAPVRRRAARAWSHWEGETITLNSQGRSPSRFQDDDFVDAFARIENHYFINKGFFERDGWLLDAVRERLPDVPGTIVHGRYDVVTPLSTAWALKKAWPKADLHIVPNAGHSSMEAGIIDQLIRATDTFAKIFARS